MMDAVTLLEKQRKYFKTGATKSLTFRKARLGELKMAIKEMEGEI